MCAITGFIVILISIMGALKTFGFLTAFLVAILGFVWYKLVIPPPVAKFDRDQYWGPGERPAKVDEAIRNFKIDVPAEDIEDLKWRLDHLRPLVPPLEGIQQQYGMNTNLVKEIVEFWKTKYNWTERQAYLNQYPQFKTNIQVPPLEGIEQQYGMNTNLVKKIVEFWKTKYNWTERQAYLNQYPQFKTNIQGLDIHFLHVKPQNSKGKTILPLLIIHGWPGSVREFYDIIPILTNPSKNRDFVFEVIAPHLPGYGFSQGASKPGLNANQMAVIMNNLMQRLGFKKYYCQGGDFGAATLQALSVIYPENVLGYHTNMAVINTPLSYVKYFLGQLYPSWIVRPDHKNRIYPLMQKFENRIRETGYLHLQATKPDTLGVGVTDSPAGLAAYILEKFTTGTNIFWQAREDGGLQEKFTYTALLDNVMIYWITGSATTSFRLYSESFSKAGRGQNVLRQPLQVPTAIARFKFDFYVADGIISEIFPNNLQLSDFEGGHFAAFELPEVLAEDLFAAVEKFIDYNKKKERITQ